jgi:N-methylhydantoinase A
VLLGVDVGGTFTDAVLVGADGAVHTAKVPTTPADESRGVLAAVGEALTRASASTTDVTRFSHGMTVATNALLEGKTARTALVATAGFTDVLELGRQARPHLYRLCDSAPAPLVESDLRFAAPERCTPSEVLIELTDADARMLAERVADAQVEAVAVALLHSYAHPEHERRVGAALATSRGGGSAHVSLSSELVGTFREYERTATTVLDAALSPLVGSYLRGLAQECTALELPTPDIMQSSGGLTTSERAAGHAALTALSGPAGGVGGALLLAALAGVSDALCLDMGGTSCDVCVITDGQVQETTERTIAGRPLALPTLDIHTVGAGGGSIAWRDSGGALRVGPESAGAVPGPACYGHGGELPTVTDANLLLDRLPQDTPLAGSMALQRAPAERAVGRLADELGLGLTECAAGIARVAESEMLGALRVMTVQRGVDPRGYALLAFGGAGPLHACALAEQLGIAHVVCPQASGVLCALGLAAAAPRRDVARTVMLSGEELTVRRLAALREQLLARAGVSGEAGRPRDALRDGVARTRVVHELRYRGQSFELAVESDSAEPAALAEAFAQLHEQRYGYRDEDSQVELVTMRASAWGVAPPIRLGDAGAGGQRIVGPAVRPLPQATLFVPAGWTGEADRWGTIHLRPSAEQP